jgi:glucosamine-6-phosphate deaminase
MVVRVDEDIDVAARAVADRICEAVQRKPNLVLGLPTGRTSQPLYAELRRRHHTRQVDFSQITTFNLDEFIGIDAMHTGSFRRAMQEQFFEPVNLAPARIGFLNGMAADLVGECRRYERAIADAGGIDIQILGIGTNGHIGFNEPGDHLIASTHRAELLRTTREANAALFGGDPSKVPPFALTMGMGTILSARELILIAFGERKARCVEQMVRGSVTTQLPASFLQLHSRVELFLDRGAASRLA